jgi:hypothetical protein
MTYFRLTIPSYVERFYMGQFLNGLNDIRDKYRGAHDVSIHFETDENNSTRRFVTGTVFVRSRVVARAVRDSMLKYWPDLDMSEWPDLSDPAPRKKTDFITVKH